MKKSRIILALCVVFLLDACAQAPVAPTSAKPTPQSGKASLLEDAERVFVLPAEAQQKELTLINENSTPHDSEIRAAMIYALTSSRYCSPTLLSPETVAMADDATREKKWDKERKTLSKQLKDSVEENQKLAQKAHEEQLRADSLQQKLDELKDIEKAMVNREQGTRK